MCRCSGWFFSLLLTGMALGCGNASPVALVATNASEYTEEAKSTTSPAPGVGEAQWPWWRGPHLDGISRENSYRTDWSMEPPITWKQEIGIGYSSVSVAQGKLFTMGHPRETDTETIWCLHPETGERLWSVSYPCALLNHLHKGGPGATPTLAGEFVYTNSREGEIRKLDIKTGELVWLLDLRKELQIDLPEWGFTCSPMIHGNEVLVEAGSVVGIDQETGRVTWKTEPHMPGYGTPERFVFAGKPYLAALNNDGLSVIDLTRKEEIAFHEWPSPYHTNATTPLWQDGQLFVSTGYNIGCVLLNFDGISLSPEWQNKEMRNHMNSCVLHQGYLYGFDGNSHSRRTVTLNCVEWSTGRLVWSQPGMGCGAVSATLEHLLITSDEGELILADLSPQGYREVGRVRVMNEQCWTVPVLCNNLVYCRGADGTLACVDVHPPGNR